MCYYLDTAVISTKIKKINKAVKLIPMIYRIIGTKSQHMTVM